MHAQTRASVENLHAPNTSALGKELQSAIDNDNSLMSVTLISCFQLYRALVVKMAVPALKQH